MKRTKVLLVGLGLGLLAGGLNAQGRPDFSGQWTSQAPPGGRGGGSAAAVSPGSGWGSSFTIKQDSDSLVLERPFFSRGDLQPPLRYRYPLDGARSNNRIQMGRGAQEQISAASWEGDRLVIQTTYSFNNPEDGRIMTGEVRQVLWLEPARMLAWPPSLVIETTRSGPLGGPPSTTRTVYTRD